MSAVVLRGDAASIPLHDASVDLICTSPPYFALRSYTDGGEHYDGQIGSEATPAEYIASLLECTREWMRVLKPEGSIFVNLGDKYSTYTGVNYGTGRSFGGSRGQRMVPRGGPVGAPKVYGIPNKSLMMLPQRYAIGCVDQLGLTLRAEIIWAKVNGMPQSAADRVRRSHEHVFHFTKQPRYFTAVDEIREAHQPQSIARTRRNRFAPDLSQAGVGSPNTLNPADACNPLGRLPESVWSIPTQPLVVPASLGVKHFASFPMELPRRIILGWSPSGICTGCGEGRRPVADIQREHGWVRRTDGQRDGNRHAGERVGQAVTNRQIASITGYVCACPDISAPSRLAVVLDPLGGAGTTALVADSLGRIGVTVDRSADYCRLARWRTTDRGERARALGVPKPPVQLEGQDVLFDLD